MPHVPSGTAAAHLPQSFQPYPYYPYYMNQYQQAAYQPPVYQQHFGKNSYGAAGFQGPTSANGPANGSVTSKGQTQGNVAPQSGYYGVAQPFYPTGYEEDPYSKNYANPPFFGGGQTSSKAQVRYRDNTN